MSRGGQMTTIALPTIKSVLTGFNKSEVLSTFPKPMLAFVKAEVFSFVFSATFMSPIE